jgi:hypothetical protein
MKLGDTRGGRMAGYEGYNKEDFEAIIPVWQHVWAWPRFASGRFGYGRGSGVWSDMDFAT